MDKFKFYSVGLVCLIVTEFLVLVFTCFYLDPPVGDTTRVSGYSENDFGWNAPQKVFEKPATPLQDGYDHYSDVFVVGDSFSFGGLLQMMNYPWQTYLSTSSGLSVSTFSHYTTKTNPPSYDPSFIPNIVNSETFKKTPPKVFVLEVVERQLNILPKIAGDCKIHNKIQKANIDIKALPLIHPTLDVDRNKQRPAFNERFPYAVKYLATFVQLKAGENQAYVFDLVTPKLFTSKSSDKLLVYEGDVKKKNWDDKLIADIKCRLINFQNLVQENGKTLFVVMVAPDKLTVYSPYLSDSKFAKISPISRLTEEPLLHLPRFDLPLQLALRQNVEDLYLPNDTHWASKGQQVAAMTLQKYISEFSGD